MLELWGRKLATWPLASLGFINKEWKQYLIVILNCNLPGFLLANILNELWLNINVRRGLTSMPTCCEFWPFRKKP